MRILVATDRIADLGSVEAGSALATGWQRVAPDSELAVVPMGESARGFGAAAAEHLGVEATLLAGDAPTIIATDQRTLVISVERTLDHREWAPRASSVELGRIVAEQVERVRPRHLVLDLGGLDAHDAGAGILRALGARADGPLDEGALGLAEVTDVDLTPVRQRLDGVTTIEVVVPPAEVEVPLLGLRGTTSLRGSSAGVDAAEMLAVDTALAAFAAAVAPDQLADPGAGACGSAFALLALGATVTTGAGWCAEQAALASSLRQADLVVTGTEVFDFATRGGGVVQYVADASAQALRPCLAVARAVLIGLREMRTMGIETAYALDEPMVDADRLVELGARVARTWDRFG